MKNLRKHLMNLWADESAQGATEYILLLVAIVALIALFKNQLMTQFNGLMGALSGSIGQVTGGGNP